MDTVQDPEDEPRRDVTITPPMIVEPASRALKAWVLDPRGMLAAVDERVGQWTRARRRRRGRPSNIDKPHPIIVALAKLAAELREQEPALGWDHISARIGTKYVGKTLQNRVEKQRLHER